MNSGVKMLMTEQQAESLFSNIKVLDTLLLPCIYVHKVLQNSSQLRTIIKQIKLLSSDVTS